MDKNSMNKHPKFAVVGHPNKGKSSIVSALALDSSVQISDTPGTTYKQRSFPLVVDGKILYELIDTPGFQRARHVLEWLEGHDVSANKKHEVVRLFINKYEMDKRFNDEIELLRPIISGAGIIYVVDGSKPYSEEYEAEMEILRWTGEPSMALINHIDDADYTLEWKRALGHYFKMVRTYNPMTASLSDHISILESMAQLKEEWISPVKSSIVLFEEYHKSMLNRSAEVLTKLVYDALGHKERISIISEDVEDKDRDRVENRYKEYLRNLEINAQKEIEKIWKHDYLEKSQTLLTFEDIDLFSKKAASVFGLTRKELLIMGATSGAIAGAGIDLLFLGHTLLLGGAIGGLVGGVGAYFGFDELSDIKVLGQSVGKCYLQMGPMQNRNFPYILLGRAIYHTYTIVNRSHAVRDIVELNENSTFKDKWLEEEVRVSLEKYHKLFRSEKVTDIEILEEYKAVILSILIKINNA
jgi:GTPase Era involved in 16S rRNA processing